MQEKFHHYNHRLKKFANHHRNNSTKAEVRLWCELFRNKQMFGFSFLRQRPIGSYIADFYCKELNLVIETDGSTHFDEEVQLKDVAKTKWLESQGYSVLRFWDDEVMNNIEGIRDRIICWIKENHRDKLPE
ncbi:MAG: endonuclease domain-containing protein [Opitutaceae bacterium]|nr:endonuclease domain-containing protein [Cytophagales bacterium]